MSFVERSSLSQRVPYRRFHCIVKCAVCSGTSDNGHSEEGTTSLRWTNCSPSAYTFEGQPLNNGQNASPKVSTIQRCHCIVNPLRGVPHSEVSLYLCSADLKGNSSKQV